MKELLTLFNTVLNKRFHPCDHQQPAEKGGIVKVKIRPLELKGQLVFQFESFTAKQAFHKNLDRDAAVQELSGCAGEFRQMQIETADAEYTVLISKKGRPRSSGRQRREGAGGGPVPQPAERDTFLKKGNSCLFSVISG